MSHNSVFRMPSKGMLLLNIPDFEARIEPLGVECIRPYLFLVIRYLRTGPLPADPAMLANIAKLSVEEWAEHGRLLLTLFEKGRDGLWHDAELDREFSKAQARSRQGTKAVQRRWKASSARNQVAGGSAAKNGDLASSARNQAAVGSATKKGNLASSARNRSPRSKGAAA